MPYKVREARKIAGLTQTQLAQKSNVSRTIISGLESGRVTITTTQTLCKLAMALGQPVESLFFTQ